MAHDRTKRFPKLITQTPPKIGPGTYDVSDLPEPKRHLADCYPFLSGSKRRTIAISRDAERLPGPGTYNIKEPQRHIPEHARFKEKIPEGPGPVDYHVAADLIKSRKIRCHPGTWRGPAGKLWLTRPPRSIIPNPTSIPDKNYTAYSINENGSLVKNPPFRKKTTFFYNVPRGEANATTLLYKGNFWSRMTGRIELPPSLTPGPGDYEHEAKKTAAQAQDEKVREAKRMSSWQPRFLDTMCRKKARENFPAPNAYNVKGNFEKFFKIDCKCDPYVTEPPPFGQTAKRFEDKAESNVPGPGKYDSPVRIKCTGSIYPAPFGTCVGRFPKISDDTGPGPSDYHSKVGNLAYESEKRYRYAYLRQLQPRIYLETISYPNEEDYNNACSPEKTEEKKSAVYHAAFKSKTQRFPKIEKTAPDSGAYEVLTAFKANRDKCDFLCPRLAPPFGTRSKRLPKSPRDIKDMPDPTYYNVITDISENVKGGVIPESEKIAELSFSPPPTRYCVSFDLYINETNGIELS
uniref:sperm-tail PG-rich repeat-containing protein 2-like n=1 Tax=Bombus vancouverensis nearcticus TaxID=2705178 RepID=UPI001439C3D8|nr:sperm-tail PG-rich repeat-containing protein 2-like [Bombus vancouverensis nearcticus]